jgi:molybdate transport system substrate-binding protein
MILLLLACSPERAHQADSHTITVLAASSLTLPFQDAAAVFEQTHPDVTVTLSFAGSQALATQIRHGMDADVFASADALQIQDLADQGLVAAPTPFAGNRLALAVSPSVTGALTLETLPNATSLVLGADQVPLGRYTETLLDAAQAHYGDAWRQSVDQRVVSREPNARLVVAKVGLGEADAAVVYATDTHSQAQLVPLPQDLSPRPVYLHAPLSPPSALALEWVAFLESSAGQDLLAEHGFVGVP